ncbi:MAG: Eco57I restriction-modification methylase domain-containing protein, partial [Bacteroidales bacterium]|nr:Eco57I restriction-modification methylase domain-containing protein [Bacteroidales bacterium]
VIRLDDGRSLGLFKFEVADNIKIARNRKGLRDIAIKYVDQDITHGALVFYYSEDQADYRLTFVSKQTSLNEDGEFVTKATAPKRYTFLLGENEPCTTSARRLKKLIDAETVILDDVKEAFSVEALTKEFYNELFDWYQRAVNPNSGIYFPNNTDTVDDDFEDIDKKIIRLITRLMFVWFIKQKGLVPNCLFEETDLQKILTDFDPLSTEQGNYYNAILQNLFFATLNRAIEDEEGKRGFAKLKGQRDVKTLYRYAEMFNLGEEDIIQLFSEVPFLNGGLFECLDKTKKIDGVETPYNYDGFSRNDFKFANGRYRHRAFIPNKFFFEPEQGLLSILKRYNFTIEENTPNEQQVALDPELLGKVFENLLGAYNPETKETARNQSGSFYTPREIVSYMVDESLIAYLGDTPLVRSMFRDDFVPDELHWSDYQLIAGKLKSVKILDPACGSGAFPMGLLNRIVELLQKIETDKTTYELKLNIIENCIYGSDIQSIAAQITKLRFFISLICDCEKDASKPNFGIPTLPNLETKFVTANSLIGLRKIREGEFVGSLFENPEIAPTKDALRNVRHEHFKAKTASAKQRLRKQDDELRKKLAGLLTDDNDFAPEDAKQMAEWNPYDQNATSPFFDSEWMFGVTDGFDIVIGNPPYIQLQNDGGKLGKLYQPCGFKTFASTGDIYCLFYERGHQLLKQDGHLCYITSNKWMRAGYGEKTRGFFAKETDPKLLIDFAGVKVFESATVDTNILLFSKSSNKHETVCAVTNKQNKDSVKNLSDFVRQQHSVCDFSDSNSWVILSPIEQSIKKKIETVGVPLKDWDININYGIKTGFNDAFIITTEKRNEILANCQTDDERQRTAELIRPILRGRDIKRYGYEWADLWLINTHNGIKGKIPPIDINDYPAIKQHLDCYWDKISKRDDKGVTPYNLRNCAYLDDFFKPKICWKAVGRNLTFAIVEAGTFLTAPASFIQAGRYNEYIMAFLCSTVGKYFIYQNSDTTGAGDIMLNIQSLIKFPIPICEAEIQPLSELVKQQSLDYSSDRQQLINLWLYKSYGFNSAEIEAIENC